MRSRECYQVNSWLHAASTVTRRFPPSGTRDAERLVHACNYFLAPVVAVFSTTTPTELRLVATYFQLAHTASAPHAAPSLPARRDDVRARHVQRARAMVRPLCGAQRLNSRTRERARRPTCIFVLDFERAHVADLPTSTPRASGERARNGRHARAPDVFEVRLPFRAGRFREGFRRRGSCAKALDTTGSGNPEGERLRCISFGSTAYVIHRASDAVGPGPGALQRARPFVYHVGCFFLRLK